MAAASKVSPPWAPWGTLRSALCLACLWAPAAVPIGGVAGAQEAQPGAPESVVDVPTVTGRTLRLLRQADALLEDAQWDDALETIQTVIENESGELVAASPGRYAPLLDACHARIARLPPEALAQYRRRVDPIADRLLEQARDEHDPRPLRRIIAEYFCSSHGDDALWLHSDLALERGDYVLARRSLQRVHAGLTGPGGRPVALAVRGINLQKYWPELEPLLLERHPDAVPPTYPDADVPLADALARLAVVSIREHDFDRAATEIELLKLLAPEATGRLAGRDAEFAPALAEMLSSARAWPTPGAPSAWPTFGGDNQRRGVGAPVGTLAGPMWPKPFALDPVASSVRQSFGEPERGPLTIERDSLGRLTVLDASSPATDPCVYGRWILARDGGKIAAIDLLTGEPAVTRTGVLYRAAPAARRGIDARQLGNLRLFNGQLGGRIVINGAQPAPAPEGPLTVVEGVLYARVPPEQAGARGGRPAAAPCLRGFDLTRDALETTRIDPPEAPWQFSGPPLVHGGRLYVTLSADEVRPRVALACYSPASATGEPLWLTELCTGPPSSAGASQRPPDVLTLAGDTLALNTNFGAVAAVDAATGRVHWVREYDRDEEQGLTDALASGAEHAAPCVYDRGRLYVAPRDSAYVFALDASSGHTLWATRAADHARQLLGVAGDVLVASGRALAGIDTSDGSVRYEWPDGASSGIRGMGRGCLAGGEVFWPTRDAIYILDAATGATSRSPVDLSPYSSGGANLTPAQGMLVVSTDEGISVLGPYRAQPKRAEPGPKVSVRERRL